MLTYAPGRTGHRQPAQAVPLTPPPPSPQPAGLSSYRRVDLESRVAAASPHMLVLMLFERLQLLLREARAATARHDTVGRCRAFEKALALVDGLDTTLDDARGGEVARTLHRTYAVLRDLIADGSDAALGEAAHMADALADAWRRIGPPARG